MIGAHPDPAHPNPSLTDRPVRDDQRPRRILATLLGTNKRETEYRLADRANTVRATLAPLALVELLADDERPDTVLALCTEAAARETLPELEAGLARHGVVCEVVPVPDGTDPESLDTFLRRFTGALGTGPMQLRVDLTHGFRHLATLAYVALLYVEALHEDIEVVGVHYGQLESGVLHDLDALLRLPRWLHAVATLRETGSTSTLAQLLRGLPRAEPELVELLDAFGSAWSAAMPLELAWVAHKFGAGGRAEGNLRRAVERSGVPLAGQLSRAVSDAVASWRTHARLSDDRPKPGRLDDPELDRQRRLVEALWHRGARSAAMVLMREWVTSWVLLHTGDPGRWLEREERERAGRKLTALQRAFHLGLLAKDTSDERVRLAEFLGALAELRNAHAHAGMRRQLTSALAPPSHRGTYARNIAAVWEGWRWLVESADEWLRRDGDTALRLADPTGVVLVSAQGSSPGVLYSALRSCDTSPDACLVVTSAQARPLVDQALRRAGWDNEPVVAELADPFAGIAELESLVQRHLPLLAGAERVEANLTGGTTLMGVAVERLAAQAASLAVPVRRFALIDSRSPDDQRRDPWVAGTRIELPGPGPNP